MSVRIGAVTYLNARPLVYDLDRLAPDAEIVIDYPSRLAQGLDRGTLDVAMIPSIEYLRQPGRRIVSDACIACDGAVRSVKLYGRVPVERIRTLALDEGSRTSAALTRILLKERFSLEPELLPLPLPEDERTGDATNPPTQSGGFSAVSGDADAVMLIGDRGMLPPEGRFEFVWDLGEEWTRWTGLPFVFALWVARPGVDLGDVEEALTAARDEGVGHLEDIARSASCEMGLPEAECLCYLRDNLKFHLGPRQRQGLELFYRLAARHGLAPAGGELVFYHRDDSR